MDLVKFQELSRECHDDTWRYNPDEKCGYSSLRNFPHSCYSLSRMKDYQGESFFADEEYIIDFNRDECEGYMKETSKKEVNTPVKFRLDAMKKGCMCVDYNAREVYVYECDDYDTPNFFTYVDGECVDEE